MMLNNTPDTATIINKDIIVSLNGVYAALQGKVILEDISFATHQGSFTGIIGPNGAGKTTLLRLILGLLVPVKGEVKVFGQNPVRMNRINRDIGYVAQKPRFDHRFPVCVRDVVLMGTIRKNSFFKLPGKQDIANARQVMNRIGILELENRPIGELSGGQQQLVLLAGALVSKPKLLILDEPTTGLDLYAQHKFYRLVKELQKELDLTVIAVSHDLAAIAANSHELICINRTMHLHNYPLETLDRLYKNGFYQCDFDLLFGFNNRGNQK